VCFSTAINEKKARFLSWLMRKEEFQRGESSIWTSEMTAKKKKKKKTPTQKKKKKKKKKKRVRGRG
jgi:hypothetical protein